MKIYEKCISLRESDSSIKRKIGEAGVEHMKKQAEKIIKNVEDIELVPDENSLTKEELFERIMKEVSPL